MPEPQPPLAGATFAHYRLENRLGAGGMGEVYAAEDTKLGRRIALKILPPDLAGDPLRLERFRREARAVAALNHPNIITIHSVEEDRGIHFLTMELVEGETLRQRLRPGGLPLAELLELAVPLADAVGAAHERGITHRDLKPENVMVTRDGRVKVLDFGLARLRDRAVDSQAATFLTEVGTVMGTAAYLSPEQAMGREVDARSDIFSLGIVLFEMAAGRHPFAGASAAEIVSAILRDKPPPVTERNAALPNHLGRIIGRCLEKNPEHRYQSAKDLRNDLRGLARELEEAEIRGSRSVEIEIPPPPRRRRLLLPVLAAVVALAGAGALYWLPRRGADAGPSAAPAPAGAPPRTALAVLHFQNLTGDRELDWLRTGLTEMLVTDLAQSPELEVLGTDRLYQILADVEGLGPEPLAFDTLQEVARRAAAEKVVLGNYARLASDLRIAFKIEDPATGAILASDTVLGKGEAGLLPAVDELTAAVRRHLKVSRLAAAPARMEEISTSSVDAWRLYTEALDFHNQGKDREAILLLERAVELDPTFALALASLGRFHVNLGHAAAGNEYTRRAVELADRLPVRQRFFLQGRHFAAKWATYGQAVAAFQEAVRLYPGEETSRNNLAELYGFLERYDDAVREYEGLIAEDTPFSPTYLSAANAYAALGRFERGHRLLSELAARDPESWLAEVGLGWHLTQWGRLDDARRHLDRAAELRPGDGFVHHARWRLEVLREDWDAAQRESERLAGLADSYAGWRGAASRARNLLYRGESSGALRELAAAARASPEPDAFAALARVWAAEVHLARGDAARALAEARLAQQQGRGEWPELEGLFFAALAEQQLGRAAAADRTVAELRRRAAAYPNAVEERQILHLTGLLALARGDAATAVRHLTRAAALLQPRGVEFHWHTRPDHVPVWYALGQAELAAGDPAAARGWFERVARSGAEHIEFPLPYVRSFYFLGRIDRERGATEAARRSLQRFLGFWQAGDLDRQRVGDAAARLHPAA
ncbi:MAG TPA: protein kinase [Thermoanaerobaculia bacterium]|nr:protein kinase [Thermoanaerobaculia bacterium]